MKKAMYLMVIVMLICMTCLYVGCSVENEDYQFTYSCVVMIGVDGMGHNESIEHTPNIHKIFEDGATTHKMLTANPTMSAQCWGSILCGVDPEISGFTNESIAVARNDSGELPTVFKQIRKVMPQAQLASFCEWSPINYGIIESDIDVLKYNDIYGNICVSDREIYESTINFLNEKNKTVFLYIHFGDVDIAGHNYGFEQDEYYSALFTVDGYIGAIYDKIVSNGWVDKTLFLLSVDHGGIGHIHGGLSDNEKYVFFGAKGITVNNVMLENMNAYDVPSVITTALGIDDAEGWMGSCPSNLFNDKR